ncbi:hypothetical protein [Myxacorys almedinensis]|uniref:PEP-CTERM sorting domain-containing protein n=1 Tax=Myxacorys almedinensis A TaxID=2690445 RepID=A0A8J8CK24_9CYAN|nr:hypothetical protein [Myxacorys almedinensis]NDJ16205.1 hypothetical protein [Myxacorys almedinensis A]
MKILLTTALTSTLLLLGAAKTQALTLYNGSLGTPPGSQGWTFVPGFSPPFATQTSDSTGTTLNTTANDSIQAGYSRSDQSFDRSAGYTLRFDLQLLSENHANPNAQNNPGTDSISDRAGLSIIALSSDQQGIELGFWDNEIWAQEDGAIKADPTLAPTGTRFTHAEGASFNTQAAIAQYELSILNNAYYLYANGNYGAPLLTGRLRNYAAEGSPYTIPNFLFVGDNTTSAQGSFKLAQVDVSNSAITPVPFVFNPLVGLGAFGLGRIRKAIRKRRYNSADFTNL